MRKIFLFFISIITVSLLFSCGSDGGSSFEDIVLEETGNIWFKYTDSSDTKTKPTGTSGSTTENLANIYIKYDTANQKLILAAVGNTIYATTTKDFSSGKWAVSVVTLRLDGKITKANTDPTSGKILISNFEDWGEFTIEYLIGKLFE